MTLIITNGHEHDDRARYLALVTILMSIPLLFPPGTLHGLLLSWWLLSTFAVPVLIFLGLIMAVWTLVTHGPKSSFLRWNLLGIAGGVIGLVIEFIPR